MIVVRPRRGPGHLGSIKIASRPSRWPVANRASPPAARAMLRAMLSPSPVPPVSRLRELFKPVERLEHALELVFGIPGPSSRTRSVRLRRLSSTLTWRAPAVDHGVVDQVADAALQRLRIPRYGGLRRALRSSTSRPDRRVVRLQALEQRHHVHGLPRLGALEPRMKMRARRSPWPPSRSRSFSNSRAAPRHRAVRHADAVA